MEITQILNTFINKKNLTTKESYDLLSTMMSGEVTPSQIGALLTAFQMKGETIEEITGLIQAMRDNMVKVTAANAIDVCGTGGDGSGTFNISTVVSFVVAGVGVPVVKHGNRAASSSCGSADVLEKLGVQIQLNAKQAEEVIKKVGMVFLFAPAYHPATKHVAIVRKELKVRTIFNVLGPFANPSGVSRQIIGVPNKVIAKKLAEVAKNLAYTHLLIVTSEDGLDEISISKPTKAFEIKGKKIKEFTIDPGAYGFKSVALQALKGGNAEENAVIIRNILQGEKGAQRNIVVLNSAFALYVSGKVKNITDGISLAEESIDSGAAESVLKALITETNRVVKSSK